MSARQARNHKDDNIEQIHDDIVDLGEYARLKKQPPLAKGYKFTVNGTPFVIENPNPTGREILASAKLSPAEDYTLRVKIAGEHPKKIALDESVDLRTLGIEKFKALPRDQTEG